MTGLQESAPGPGTTGPRTREGKAIACLNNLKHGLTGAFRMMEFESQSDFDAACRLWCRTQLLQNKPLTAGDDQRFSLYICATSPPTTVASEPVSTTCFASVPMNRRSIFRLGR